jgi:RNA polymerase sigma factor (sigma-70 family)
MSALRGRRAGLERLIEIGEAEPLPTYLPSSNSAYDPEIVLAEWQIDLNKILDDLSVRERNVIEMRFGLNDGVPKTLDEIGKVHGVARERVRKLIDSALEKLSARTDLENNLADLPTLT